MRLIRAVTTLLLAGCFTSPLERSNTQMTSGSITVGGYTPSTNRVLLYARDHNTNTLVLQAAVTPGSFNSTLALYPWSTTRTFAANYWAPQFPGLPNAAVASGRLELSATLEGTSYGVRSFSQTGSECLTARLNEGVSAVNAGNECADGTDVVLFDQDGPNFAGSEPLSFVPAGAGTEVVSGVTISLQSIWYQSQGLRIAGVLCRPVDATVIRRPARILNHGGIAGVEEGAMALCRRWASQGLVVAASAYRGETAPNFGTTSSTNLSDGQVETCLGEVTDVMRLTAIIAAQPFVNRDRMTMWGYSHGGCITTRAVQRGAPVKAAVDVAGLSELGACDPDCSAGVFSAPTEAGAFVRVRSPLAVPKDLAVRTRVHSPRAPEDVKYLRIDAQFGTPIGPLEGCRLMKAVWPDASTPFSWNVTPAGSGFSVLSTPPTACSTTASTLAWNTGPLPTSSWPVHSFVFVQGATHWTVDDIALPIVEQFFGDAFSP